MSVGKNFATAAFRLEAGHPMPPCPQARELRLRILLVEGNRELAGFIAAALRAIRGGVTSAETAVARVVK